MNKSWVTTFVVILKSIWSSLVVSLKTNVGKDVVHNKCKWRCTQWFFLTCMLKTLQIATTLLIAWHTICFYETTKLLSRGKQNRSTMKWSTTWNNNWNWALFKTLKINNCEYHLLMTKIYAQNGTMLSKVLQLELWSILICLSSSGFLSLPLAILQGFSIWIL
jgi:hypothetical protein